MSTKPHPLLLPTSFEKRIRKNASSMYVDAGTGNTKLIVYRINYWEDDPQNKSTRVCAQDQGQCEPLLGNDHLDQFADTIMDRYFESFADKVVLGATEWRRKHKPEDPHIEEFCSTLSNNNVDIVQLDGKLEAAYEAIAVKFALDMYSVHTNQPMGCEYYVSGGGGSLQFGNLHEQGAKSSFSIKVKHFTDQIWNHCKQGHFYTTGFDTHCNTLHDMFCALPKITKGTLLCMGSFFYSAKEVRMHNKAHEYKLYDIKRVLLEMNAQLKAQVRQCCYFLHNAPTMVSKKDVRAYVALKVNYTFLNTIVRDDTRILFKRDWAIGKNTLRTTWTLGHFLSTL